MFYFRIGIPMSNLLNDQTRCGQGRDNFIRREKEKIDRNRVIPPFIEVYGAFSHMECQKKVPASLQQSFHFPKCTKVSRAWDIHDRIKCDNAIPGFVLKV